MARLVKHITTGKVHLHFYANRARCGARLNGEFFVEDRRATVPTCARCAAPVNINLKPKEVDAPMNSITTNPDAAREMLEREQASAKSLARMSSLATKREYYNGIAAGIDLALSLVFRAGDARRERTADHA